MFLADRAELSYAETAARLRDAGVYWVTGGGSEILTEDFRKRHAKFKYTVAEYFEAQRAIVESGLRTTATMVIGFDETLEERLEHLQRTRDFQDDCLRDGLRRALLVPLVDVQAVRHGARRPRDRARASTGGTSRSRASSSTTSSTSGRRC